MVSDLEIPPVQPPLPADALTTGNGKSAARGSTRASASASADEPRLRADDIDRIIDSRHECPHRVLGPHPAADGSATVVRAFLPGADHVVLLRTDTEPKQYEMRKTHPDGLFEVQVPAALPLFDYAFLVAFGGQRPVRLADPYRFRTIRFSAKDERLFGEGRHTRLFETLGAWPQVRQNTAGVAFGVWAPNAARVSVVGTFNGWDGRRHPMQRLGSRGIWELFIPGIAAGELYKFEIKTGEGAVFLKTDPFAVCREATPSCASIVVDLDGLLLDGRGVAQQRPVRLRARAGRAWGAVCRRAGRCPGVAGRTQLSSAARFRRRPGWQWPARLRSNFRDSRGIDGLD